MPKVEKLAPGVTRITTSFGERIKEKYSDWKLKQEEKKEKKKLEKEELKEIEEEARKEEAEFVVKEKEEEKKAKEEEEARLKKIKRLEKLEKAKEIGKAKARGEYKGPIKRLISKATSKETRAKVGQVLKTARSGLVRTSKDVGKVSHVLDYRKDYLSGSKQPVLKKKSKKGGQPIVSQRGGFNPNFLEMRIPGMIVTVKQDKRKKQKKKKKGKKQKKGKKGKKQKAQIIKQKKAGGWGSPGDGFLKIF